MFKMLAQDQTPPVRKQAAISLREMAVIGARVPENEL